MATRTARSAPPLLAGPWKGVRDTTDPFDDTPDYLVDASNCYIPDPQGGSGLYARPGFELCNDASQLGSGSFNGTGEYVHTAYSGKMFNFVADGGKLYRLSADLKTQTDVTPTVTGFWFGSSAGSRVYFDSFNDCLIINDTLNKPWYVASTDLSATPLVPKVIEYTTAVVNLERSVLLSGTALQMITTIRTLIDGQIHSVPANPDIALPAGTIPIDTWGIYRVSVNASSSVTATAGAANYTTGYADEAAAIAALPALSANTWDIGYVTVKTHAGTTFVAGTDSLAGGATGNVASATNYYAGMAAPWTAQHMTVYGGALFFLAKMIDFFSLEFPNNATSTILWSEISDQTTGYQQDGFDNVWSLIQSGSSPIYAIWGTNTSLLYFRDQTIGTIAGPVGPNLQSTATHDAIAYNTGTRAPAAIAAFGDTIFFADSQGRPQMIRPGVPPIPIWLNMRALVDAAETEFPIVTGEMAVGVVEPRLNLYVVALWSPVPSSALHPESMVAFDVKTGAYVGQWTIGAGMTVGSIGILAQTTNGVLELVVLGSKVAGQAESGGYLWRLRQLSEDSWEDNGVLPTISATTQRLGYTANRVLHADLATIITDVDTPCTVTTLATGTPSTVEGTPSPSASQDGTYRLVCGLDAFGRGIQVTVSPTAATQQWCLQQILVQASSSLAGPEDS